MKKRTIFFLATCITLSAFSVKAAAQNFSCSCPALLKETVGKIDSMYAGFNDCVTRDTREAYREVLKDAASDAQKSHSYRDCYESIRKYTQWFNDKHLGLWFGINTTANDIRKVSTASLTQPAGNAKGLEGIWVSDDGKQRWKIMRDAEAKNAFIAVVLNSKDSGWKAGMVKVEFYYYDSAEYLYRGMFYQDDFKGKLDGFTLDGHRLSHWFGGGLHRENAAVAEQPVGDGDVSYKKLNADFCYLKLAHFESSEVAQLDSLIDLNKAEIHSTRNLVIDLRGNSGGNANSSQKMIELIYTNPMLYPAWQYKSSPEIIAETTNELDQLRKTDPYKQLTNVQQKLDVLMKSRGQLVTVGDSIVRTCDSVAVYPKKVVLLVDRRSGSSSEFFIFESKQSSKTIIYGTPSAGGMDYGDAHSFPLSCGEYSLQIAWGRNGWIDRFGYRIDGTGFKPDVEIKGENVDWLKYVVDHVKY